MWSRAFWAATAERATKTFAQVFLTTPVVTNSDMVGLPSVTLVQAMYLALWVAVLSLMTSLASYPLNGNRGPSLASERLDDIKED